MKANRFEWSSALWRLILFVVLAQAFQRFVLYSEEKVQLSDPGQFQITRLEFSTNGSVAVSKSIPPFFYGQPLNGIAKPANKNGGLSVSSTGPPVRPAPRYDLSHWTQEHGLPATRVRTLLQTRDGYLWVGTSVGLARFDGMRFTIFNQTNTPQLATNGQVIRALYEDEMGTLWVGTERGVLRRANSRFSAFPGQKDVRDRSINCLVRRGAGGFWIGAEVGVGYCDGTEVRWLSIPDITQALSIVEAPNGILWVGTIGGVVALEVTTGRMRRMLTRKELISGREAPPHVLGLLLDHRDRLWIGSNKGIWRLDTPDGMPINAGEWAYASNARFARDAQNGVWTTVERDGTQLSAYRMTEDEGGNIVPTLAARMLGQTTCIAAGQEGEIWIGGWNGLFRLRSPAFTSMSFDDRGLNAEMRAVTTGTDGALWFANAYSFGRWSEREITLFDSQGAQSILNGKAMTLKTPLLAAGAFNLNWATHSHGGLISFQEPSNDWSSHLNRKFPKIGLVHAMTIGRSGTLWVAAENGLYHLPEPSTINRIAEIPGIRVLLEDAKTNVWFATDNGQLFLHSSAGQTQRINLTETAGIISLHSSADGAIWMGTRNGLRRFADGKSYTFGPESGVPQEAIYGIIEDPNGRLWMNYNLGIVRVQRRELEQWLLDHSRSPAISAFGAADGILSLISMPSSQSCVRSSDGRLWFIKRGGLTVVDPAESLDAKAPRVFIERIAAGGTKGDVQEEKIPELATDPVTHGQTTRSIELAPGNGRHLEIHFTTTALHSPERARIRYQLEGHDPGWREGDSARRASYTNLRPGRYLFRVRAQNHEGRWSENDAVLAFQIAPFFWQTRLFPALSGAGIIGIIAGMVTWRLRRQEDRLKLERLNALEKERERIARNMHDNLGAHLTELAFTVGRNGEAGEKVRESLHELRDAVWTVNPRNDSLTDLVQFISEHATRSCSAAGLRVELDLPMTGTCPIPGTTRYELAAMFKEAIRNILQHAQAKTVRVEMRMTEGRLLMIVEDDGCGFELAGTADRTRGNGLRNFIIRSESVGGDCRIRSTPGQGTRIEFTIPLAQQTGPKAKSSLQRWLSGSGRDKPPPQQSP